MFDGKVPHWYHYTCFFIKQRPRSIGDISHFESLRWEDQEKIKEKIDSAGMLIQRNAFYQLSHFFLIFFNSEFRTFYIQNRKP